MQYGLNVSNISAVYNLNIRFPFAPSTSWLLCKVIVVPHPTIHSTKGVPQGSHLCPYLFAGWIKGEAPITMGPLGMITQHTYN